MEKSRGTTVHREKEDRYRWKGRLTAFAALGFLSPEVGMLVALRLPLWGAGLEFMMATLEEEGPRGRK